MIERWAGRWDKQLDATSSLIHMGEGPYDPELGRFLAVDPIEGGSSYTYDYSRQDPVNGYDLSGEAPEVRDRESGTANHNCRPFCTKWICYRGVHPDGVQPVERHKLRLVGNLFEGAILTWVLIRALHTRQIAVEPVSKAVTTFLILGVLFSLGLLVSIGIPRTIGSMGGGSLLKFLVAAGVSWSILIATYLGSRLDHRSHTRE
jgi:RHS repeat-associated protein